LIELVVGSGASFAQKKSAGDEWRAAGHIIIKETFIKTVIYQETVGVCD
jgi:hypothetical protein